MACASSTRTASPSARAVPAALAISSGDPAWDALIAAYLDVLEKDPRSLACMATWSAYRSEEAAVRGAITYTPAPNHLALFQKLTVGRPYVDNLFNPEDPRDRRDVAAKAKTPDAWPGAPLFFAIHDKAMRDPTSPRIATTPQKIAELASGALTPIGCVEPYDFFGDVEAQSEKAARATAFSPYAVSLFRACYLDACRLSGATPPTGMTYPDAADEIAAECGMSQAEARWRFMVATWEAEKVASAVRTKLEEDQGIENEEPGAANAYWKAYEAIVEATPPTPAALAYQLREMLNIEAFPLFWQNADCPRSLADLISDTGAGACMVYAYQAALRMAGIDSPALAAKWRPSYQERANLQGGAEIHADWLAHHELFEALEALDWPDQRPLIYKANYTHHAFEIARYRLKWTAQDIIERRPSYLDICRAAGVPGPETLPVAEAA